MKSAGKPESFLTSIRFAVVFRGLNYAASLGKHILIAAAIGLSAQLDVFYMAIAIISVLVFSLGGVFDVIAIPRLVTLWTEARTDEFKKLSSELLTFTLLVSLVLIGLMIIIANYVWIIAMGFEANRRFMLTKAMIWLLPTVALYLPYRCLASIMRASRRFSPFYVCEFLISVAILLLVWSFRKQQYVLFWSYDAGMATALATAYCYAQNFRLKLKWPFSPEVKKLLITAPNLLLLQATNYVYVLSARFFMSFLSVGALGALAYGRTLVTVVPDMIFLTGSFITIYSEASHNELLRAKKINDIISFALFVTIPVSLFLFLFRSDLIHILLERGAFTHNDTNNVAIALAGFVGMLLPWMLVGVLDQVFQVERRMGMMIWRTLFGILVNTILNFWFLFGLSWGIGGIAISTAISYWIMLITGLKGLQFLRIHINWFGHARWAFWLLLIAIIGVTSLRMIPAYSFSTWPRIVIGLLTLGGCSLIGGLVYNGKEGALVRNMTFRVARLMA